MDVKRIRFEEDDLEDGQATSLHDFESLAKRSRLSPYILFVRGQTCAGMLVPVRSGFVIGRSATADIQIVEEGVSRQHLKVSTSSDGFLQLDDLGSSNGLVTNGERVSNCIPHEGQRIAIGNAELVIVYLPPREVVLPNTDAFSGAEPETGVLHPLVFQTRLDMWLRIAARQAFDLAVLLFQPRPTTTPAGLRQLGQLVKRLLVDYEGLLLGRDRDDALAVMAPFASKENAAGAVDLVRTAVSWDGANTQVNAAWAMAADPETAADLLTRTRTKL